LAPTPARLLALFNALIRAIQYRSSFWSVGWLIGATYYDVTTLEAVFDPHSFQEFEINRANV
jgi:hypothetical protein